VSKTKTDSVDITLLKDENYGVLLPFVKDIDVTDINWNGMQLWVDDLNKGRYMVQDIKLTPEFVESFAIRISNIANKTFNKYNPKLEAETEELRITVIHESVSHTGTSISIRKTPAVKRIEFEKSINSGDYCSREVADFISNCVKAKLNIVICGLPGVGKTELLKYLTNYIQPRDRVITIEDTLEIHYSKINVGYDCLEFKVDDKTFTYVDAIKESLRLLPQWILLSEARSREVRYLIESLSTGAKCLTTIHADDVTKIPDRIKNMLEGEAVTDNIEDQIYEFLDIVILIDKTIDIDEDGYEHIKRFISQVAVYSRDEGWNNCNVVIDEGKRTDANIQASVLKKFKLAGIDKPFEYNKQDWGNQMKQVEEYRKSLEQGD
jgi:pilus assembly protein CpaF